MDCGTLPDELQHFRDGVHTYAEYLIFGSIPVVLCNFCFVDFGSYDPTYFGLPPHPRISISRFQLVRELYPLPERTYDYVCPDCDQRLAWVEFVVAARELHATGNA
jgi:hypothetical protein